MGVFDDRTVNEMKGCNYPVMNLGERVTRSKAYNRCFGGEQVLNVCACKHVDDVVIAAPLEATEDFLRSINANVVVQGSKSTLYTHQALTSISPQLSTHQLECPVMSAE